MSIQTTHARTAAFYAGTAWKTHRLNCVTCCDRSKIRCAEGLPLYAVHLAAEKDLKRNWELDKLPPPGQGTLFAAGEVKAS